MGRAVRDLTPEENQRVRDLIHRVQREREVNQTNLATLLGYEKPSQLSRFLGVDSTVGVSWRVAVQAAELAGESIVELLGLRPRSAETDPLPERRRAVRAARDLGYMPPAIATVTSMPPEQISSREWFHRIVAAEASLLTTPAPNAPGPPAVAKAYAQPPGTAKTARGRFAIDAAPVAAEKPTRKR